MIEELEAETVCLVGAEKADLLLVKQSIDDLIKQRQCHPDKKDNFIN